MSIVVPDASMSKKDRNQRFNDGDWLSDPRWKDINNFIQQWRKLLSSLNYRLIRLEVAFTPSSKQEKKKATQNKFLLIQAKLSFPLFWWIKTLIGTKELIPALNC